MMKKLTVNEGSNKKFTTNLSAVQFPSKSFVSDQKLLFIHIPKCAGISTIAALNKVCEVQHIGPHEKAKVIFSPENGYKSGDYYAFTFVRNPWDRLVSTFFYIMRGGRTPIDVKRRDTVLKKYNGSFEKFVLDIDNWINIKEPDSIYRDQFIPHFRPQWEYIFDDDGKLLVDFIGRVECMGSDFNRLCSTIGASGARLKKRNTSRHKSYTTYYNQRTRDLVADYYRKDIEYFDYKFGGEPQSDRGLLTFFNQLFR